MQIKLLQWNIFYKEKIENIVRLLQQINPDIFCLQELAIDSKYNLQTPNAAEHIAKQLSVNYYFEKASKQTTSEIKAIGNGIFTKFPISRKHHFFTKKPSPIVASFSDEGRVYIEVGIDINKIILTVGTVHLSYTHKFMMTNEKAKEINNLINGIKDKEERFILTGDLNATPNSYAVSELNKHFTNAGPQFSEPTWTTKRFDYQGFVENKLKWRLDYVFATKDINFVSSKTIKTNYSDHLPILTIFKL